MVKIANYKIRVADNILLTGIVNKTPIIRRMKRSIWHPDYHALRQALKDIRLEADLTQKMLADKIDKPQSFIAKYENGDRNLDFLEVLLICEACEISLENFVKRLSFYKL